MLPNSYLVKIVIDFRDNGILEKGRLYHCHNYDSWWTAIGTT